MSKELLLLLTLLGVRAGHAALSARPAHLPKNRSRTQSLASLLEEHRGRGWQSIFRSWK